MMASYMHGGDIYSQKIELDFSTNTNPFGMPDTVKEAAHLGIESSLAYPDPYCRKLVEKIQLAEGIPTDCILCGNGAAELIFNLVLALKPSKALIPVPTFLEYEQALRTVDCKIHYHDLKEENRFLPDEALLFALESEKYDIIFLCNPNNPTGQLISREFLIELLSICEKQGTICVIDECFMDFVEEEDQCSLKQVIMQAEHLFILKAFTKMYSMAGLRLGYCLCKNQALLQRMREVRQPWSVSTPAQYAGIAALEEKTFVIATRELVKRERIYLREELIRLGCFVFDPYANYIFFRWKTESESLYDLCLAHHILIRKCENYPRLDSHYYRIAVKKPEENRKLIQVLQQIMKGR